MKLFLNLLATALIPICICSCQTAPVGTAPSMPVSKVQVSPAQVKAITQLATSTFLAVEPQYTQQAKLAAAGLSVLTGSAPTTATIQSTLLQVAPKDAKYASLVSALILIIQANMPANATSSQIDQYLTAVAQGITAAVPA